MALEKFRASPLPIPGSEYDQQYMLQLIRVLGIYFSQLDSLTPNQAQSYRADEFFGGVFRGDLYGGTIAGFGSGINLPFGILISNQDQSSAGTTVENLITYSSVEESNGVTFEGSKIRFPNAGYYLITFTLQVTNQTNAIKEFEVWLKDTGTNIDSSNTRFDIPARKSVSIWGHAVPAITSIFAIHDPETEYLEIAWWSESTDVYLEHYAAGTSPTRPAIPSVILTANFISAMTNFPIPATRRLVLAGVAPSLIRGTVGIPPVASLGLTGAAPTVTIA